MKRRYILMILSAASVLLAAGALAACRPYHPTPADLAAQGYTWEVKLDFMGGTSGEGLWVRQEFNQYVKPGSLVVKPGSKDANGSNNLEYAGKLPTKDGYTFGGFYTGEKNEAGEVTYSEKWDFASDRVPEDEAGGTLTLYAYWRPNYSLVVHYGFTASEEGYTQVSSVGQSEDGVAANIGTPSLDDYTAIAFYTEKQAALGHEEEKKITFPYASAELTENSPQLDIWADAIQGNFKLVREASDFRFSSGVDLYIMNDIDFGGEDITSKLPTDGSYNAKLYGNGCTLSNFTVTRSSTARRDDYLGIFKRLGAGAELRDITFSNFTVKLTTTDKNRNYTIGALAGFASAGAKLHNVTLSGSVECTLVEQEGKETVVRKLIGECATPEAGQEAVVTEGCNADGVVFTGATPSDDE